MEIAATVNKKGGVAKTTTTACLAWAMASLGHRVLVIDADSQCNLSGWMGAGKNSPRHVGDFLLAGPEQAATWPTVQVAPNLELLPSNKLLGESLEKLTKQREAQPQRRLRTRLAQLAARYDYCLIDCPPEYEGMTKQALHAADCFVIVTDPEPFAVEGLAEIMQRVQGIQASQKEALRFVGFIIPKYHGKLPGNLKKSMLKSIIDTYTEASIIGLIRYAVAVPEAQGLRQSLFDYAPESTAAKDYLKTTQELLTRL